MSGGAQASRWAAFAGAAFCHLLMCCGILVFVAMGECLPVDGSPANQACFAEKQFEGLFLAIGAPALILIAALLERKRRFAGTSLMLVAPFALGAVVLFGVPLLWNAIVAPVR